jgi:hypothetical protein
VKRGLGGDTYARERERCVDVVAECDKACGVPRVTYNCVHGVVHRSGVDGLPARGARRPVLPVVYLGVLGQAPRTELVQARCRGHAVVHDLDAEVACVCMGGVGGRGGEGEGGGWGDVHTTSRTQATKPWPWSKMA